MLLHKIGLLVVLLGSVSGTDDRAGRFAGHLELAVQRGAMFRDEWIEVADLGGTRGLGYVARTDLLPGVEILRISQNLIAHPTDLWNHHFQDPLWRTYIDLLPAPRIDPSRVGLEDFYERLRGRTFHHPEHGTSVFLLVDLFNTGSVQEINVELFRRADGGRSVRISRPVRRGQELLLDYGLETRSTVANLATYGVDVGRPRVRMGWTIDEWEDLTGGRVPPSHQKSAASLLQRMVRVVSEDRPIPEIRGWWDDFFDLWYRHTTFRRTTPERALRLFFVQWHHQLAQPCDPDHPQWHPGVCRIVQQWIL